MNIYNIYVIFMCIYLNNMLMTYVHYIRSQFPDHTHDKPLRYMLISSASK